MPVRRKLQRVSVHTSSALRAVVVLLDRSGRGWWFTRCPAVSDCSKLKHYTVERVRAPPFMKREGSRALRCGAAPRVNTRILVTQVSTHIQILKPKNQCYSKMYDFTVKVLHT